MRARQAVAVGDARPPALPQRVCDLHRGGGRGGDGCQLLAGKALEERGGEAAAGALPANARAHPRKGRQWVRRARGPHTQPESVTIGEKSSAPWARAHYSRRGAAFPNLPAGARCRGCSTPSRAAGTSAPPTLSSQRHRRRWPWRRARLAPAPAPAPGREGGNEGPLHVSAGCWPGGLQEQGAEELWQAALTRFCCRT